MTQVFSEDINATFDAFTGASHPPLRRNIPLLPTFIDTTNTWAQTGSGMKSTSTTGFTIGASYIDCPFEAGDQILGLEVWRKSDGTAGSKEAQLFLAAAAGSFLIATISTDSIASGATTRAKLVVPASIDVLHTMAAGESLRFHFLGKTNTGYIIDAANLVVMRP